MSISSGKSTVANVEDKVMRTETWHRAPADASGCNIYTHIFPPWENHSKMTRGELIFECIMRKRPFFFWEFRRSKARRKHTSGPHLLRLFFFFFIFWLSDSHSRLCQIRWLVCLWGLWSGLRITYCSGHMLFSSLTFYCRQRWSDIKELL